MALVFLQSFSGGFLNSKPVPPIQYVSIRIFPVDISFFKINNRNTRTICEGCSNLIKKTSIDIGDVVLSSLLLTLNIFHTFWCFYCWIWISKSGWDWLKKILTSVSWLVHHTYIWTELHCYNNIALMVEAVPYFFAWPKLWVLELHE